METQVTSQLSAASKANKIEDTTVSSLGHNYLQWFWYCYESHIIFEAYEVDIHMESHSLDSDHQDYTVYLVGFSE